MHARTHTREHAHTHARTHTHTHTHTPLHDHTRRFLPLDGALRYTNRGIDLLQRSSYKVDSISNEHQSPGTELRRLFSSVHRTHSVTSDNDVGQTVSGLGADMAAARQTFQGVGRRIAIIIVANEAAVLSRASYLDSD